MLEINVGEVFNRLVAQMDRIVIGYPVVKRLSIAAILADQHVLLEGLPGTAKSLFVEVFQRAVRGGAGKRIQMTADMKPMDIVGTEVYNPGLGKFVIKRGPICDKNFVLVDEINRTPPKTLSSILSAMQERRVVIGDEDIALPDPFFVMATQNPIEQEGVFDLPEATIDRFGMKLVVPYATFDDEVQILMTEALRSRDPQNVIEPVVSTQELVAMRDAIKKVYTSEAALRYIVSLTRATRPGDDSHKSVAAKDKNFGKLIQTGASVRAEFAMTSLAQVLAALKGRSYILPEDIQEVVPPVLRHRIIMKFEAVTDGITSDVAVESILKNVTPHQDLNVYAPESAK